MGPGDSPLYTGPDYDDEKYFSSDSEEDVEKPSPFTRKPPSGPAANPNHNFQLSRDTSAGLRLPTNKPEFHPQPVVISASAPKDNPGDDYKSTNCSQTITSKSWLLEDVTTGIDITIQPVRMRDIIHWTQSAFSGLFIKLAPFFLHPLLHGLALPATGLATVAGFCLRLANNTPPRPTIPCSQPRQKLITPVRIDHKANATNPRPVDGINTTTTMPAAPEYNTTPQLSTIQAAASLTSGNRLRRLSIRRLHSC
ncbi:hypothetical protein B0H67DRAFT_592641 [Lasiosphaeris hirsuta]|uniref:Uncharacterized protein n=1 Tax=Lasiosphaeris hirsuta TaxID=260670 RepID=A0AA39ZWE0_9PEZI|nr:hypothetical protein B0H67DRAFT_592641 [Lasiosphaeris hirsuta]